MFQFPERHFLGSTLQQVCLSMSSMKASASVSPASTLGMAQYPCAMCYASSAMATRHLPCRLDCVASEDCSAHRSDCILQEQAFAKNGRVV